MEKSFIICIIVFLILSIFSLCFYLILFKGGNSLTDEEKKVIDNEQAEWVLRQNIKNNNIKN